MDSILSTKSKPKYSKGDVFKCKQGFTHKVTKPIWGGPHGRREWFYDTRYTLHNIPGVQGSPWESEVN